MLKLKILLIINLAIVNMNAQTDIRATVKVTIDEEALIKNVIDNFFDGMHTFDTVKIKSTLHEQSFLKSIIKNDIDTKLIDEPIEIFLNSISEIKNKEIKIEEKLLGYEIKIDEFMAIAWTPYEFYIDNALSHVGTNVFTLIKVNNRWKILGIIDTRKKI